MRIAIEGCSHGELDVIYRSIQRLEEIHNFKIDLLLCCGDFQAVRNEHDLKCMAVPPKYMQMQDFYKYYSGEKKAPLLTLFIGGNHEASNYLQELPYGGWVAPNIYYLGYAGVVRIGDLRIGGISGIYKAPDYLTGHYEKTPYTKSSVRSVYHVRNLEVFRMKQLSDSDKIDIFMSHDWPRGIYHHGNAEKLVRLKSFFEEEIKANKLGSRPAEDLLKKLKPTYWFSGHLHVKFSALMRHEKDEDEEVQTTRFLALDKCLPRREFLQVLELPEVTPKTIELSHDVEWLTILRLTNHLLSTKCNPVYMPGPGSQERYNFTPTPEEMKETISRMEGSLSIPVNNFVKTAECFQEDVGLPDMNFVCMPEPILNPQTTHLCSKLEIEDPLMKMKVSMVSNTDLESSSSLGPFNESEINVTSMVNSFNLSSNTEINLSDGDEFELSKDEKSGDFIMEIPLSSTVSSYDLGISPIHGEKHSTPKRECVSSHLLGSPRDSTGETPKRKFALSKPKNTLITPLKPEVKEDDVDGTITPPAPSGDSTVSESSPLSSSTVYFPLSSSQSEEESDSGRSSQKRNSSYDEKDGGLELEPLLKPEKSKKFKRRNISIYASNEDDS